MESAAVVNMLHLLLQSPQPEKIEIEPELLVLFINHLQFLRSTAQPNATPRDPTELLGSVSSHSAGTTSMVRAAVLDDSDEISRQLSLGDSEPLRFTWLSRCADVVLLGFLGEVGFEHYALTDFFQEDEEGLNQGLYLCSFPELPERSNFSPALVERMQAMPLLLSPRASFVSGAELKAAIKLELRSRLSLIYPHCRPNFIRDREQHLKIVFVRNRLRRIFLDTSDACVDRLFDNHGLLTLDSSLRTRLELNFDGGLLAEYGIELDVVRNNWGLDEFERFFLLSRRYHLDRIRSVTDNIEGVVGVGIQRVQQDDQ
ncbi:unnamed protein product [Oikopleura dioica]|uniref:Uncharacterized protein n=1 Tax=Oikopleura dioica TaxID=34765 RepID=E4Z4V5_OIKDI|nr:unnamed protein product [Oikopleura dioica]